MEGCAPIISKLQHPPLPPGKVRAFERLKIGCFQIPVPWGQNSVLMPFLIDGFFCQMSLLKNNRRLLLSSLIKCVYKHANTCLVIQYMTMPFLPDLSYCMYFELFSVRWLPLIGTHSFNNEIGLQKRTIMFSLYSIANTNYAAKIHLTVHFLKRKKSAATWLIAISLRLKSFISSKHIFIAVSDFGTRKKKIIRNLTPPVQFTPPHPEKVQIPHPREGLIRQTPHSLGTGNTQMPEVCQVGEGCWSFNLIGALQDWSLKRETFLIRPQ